MVIILYLWYIQNGAPKLLLMPQPLKHPQSESVYLLLGNHAVLLSCIALLSPVCGVGWEMIRRQCTTSTAENCPCTIIVHIVVDDWTNPHSDWLYSMGAGLFQTLCAGLTHLQLSSCVCQLQPCKCYRKYFFCSGVARLWGALVQQ